MPENLDPEESVQKPQKDFNLEKLTESTQETSQGKASEQLQDTIAQQPKETPLGRREARQKRVQKILQVLGLPGSGIGLALTINLIRNGKVTEAAIIAFITLVVFLLAIAGKFFKDILNKIFDKIEEKLEERADKLADWIVNNIEIFIIGIWWRITSQFQGKYYQSLIYNCREFKTEGFRIGLPVLDLEKVFVQLAVVTQIPDNIPGAIIQNPNSIDGQRIWDFLVNIMEIPTYRRIAVIAPPGSGKTTLLENITLTYAKKLQRRQHRKAPKLIPVLLYLRNIREQIIGNNPPNLSTLITDVVKKLPYSESENLNPPLHWFRDNLKKGKCLIMLDGLDEVADTNQRLLVSKWVNDQMLAYPKTTFILTSRPFGYRSAPVEQVGTVLQVQPFTLEQMKQFIDSWYLQTEIMSRAGRDDPGVRTIALNQAKDLFERILYNPPIAAMARNPLLLTMTATVHYCGNALPGRRVELYAKICDVLLGQRQQAKKIPDTLTPVQKKSILQLLALELMKNKTRQFTPSEGALLIQNKLESVVGSKLNPEEFLKQIETVSGLLVEREQGIYEFAHLSFQEYLASAQIKEMNQDTILIDNYYEPWWSETIRLYVAQADATNLIHEALNNQTVDALTLAFDCLEECLSVEIEVRRQLEAIIEEGLEDR